MPAARPTLVPQLLAEDCAALADFLRRAFGGELVEHLAAPDGRMLHAGVRIGDALVRVGPALPGAATRSSFFLYVADADAAYRTAVLAGAVSLAEPADQPWGDRTARVRDPAGNAWWISQHLEDLSESEIARRTAARQRG
jgi:uncharacterized glyoxalase superfamily protein PhnB